jgi:hypothetical protein
MEARSSRAAIRERRVGGEGFPDCAIARRKTRINALKAP